MSDDTTDPKLNIDRDIDQAPRLSSTRAEKLEGGIAETPDRNAGQPDPLIADTRSLSQIESDISKSFFKPPKKSLDRLSADLIGTRYTNLTSAFKRFENANGGLPKLPQLPGGVPGTPVTNPRTLRIVTAMQLAGARAQISAFRFQQSYQLPYMKRSLALAYDRTRMMKAQLLLMDKTRSQLLVKLDAIKLNTAAPESAKGSLWEKVWAETRRQSIARVASSIQDIGFQYANRAYTHALTKPITRLRDRMSRGETLSEIISNTAADTADHFTHVETSARDALKRMGDTSGSSLGRMVQSTREKVGRAGTTVFSKIHPDSKIFNALGKASYPVIDFASRYNPFNKTIFSPVTGANAGDDFVGMGSGVVNGSSPLFKAFTAWVREYRQDQYETKSILLGRKISLRKLDTTDPEQSALRAVAKDLKAQTSGSTRSSLFGSLKSSFSTLFSHPAKSPSDKARRDPDTEALHSAVDKAKSYIQTIFGAGAAATVGAAATKAASPPPRPEKPSPRPQRRYTTPPSAASTSTSSWFSNIWTHGQDIFAKAEARKPTVTHRPVGKKTAEATKREHFIGDVFRTLGTTYPTILKYGGGAAGAVGLGSAMYHMYMAHNGDASTTADDSTSQTPEEEAVARAIKRRKKRRGAKVISDPLDDSSFVRLAFRSLRNGGFDFFKRNPAWAPDFFTLHELSFLGKSKLKATPFYKRVEPTIDEVSAGIKHSKTAERLRKIKAAHMPKDTSKTWENYSPWDVVFGKVPLSAYFNDFRGGYQYDKDGRPHEMSRREQILASLKSTITDKNKMATAVLEGSSLAARAMYSPQVLAHVGELFLKGKALIPAAAAAHLIAHVNPLLASRMFRKTYSKIVGVGHYDADGIRKPGAVRDAITRQFINKFAPGGKATKRLLYLLTLPSYRNIVDGTALKRLRNGERLQDVLTLTQLNALTKKVNAFRGDVDDTLGVDLHTAAAGLKDKAKSVLGDKFGGVAGAAGATAFGVLFSQFTKNFGSLSDNMKSVTEAMGIQTKDNIFKKYEAGIRGVNNSVKSGGSLFAALTGIGLNAIGVPLSDEKKKEYQGRLLGFYGANALRKLGRKAFDKATGRSNTPPPEPVGLGRRAFNTVRKVIYNPTELTNAEFKAKRKADAKAEKARAKQAAKDRVAQREKQAKEDHDYYEKYKNKQIAKDAATRRARRGGHDTLADILLTRLGLIAPRKNSFEDMQRRKRDPNAWYTWRRALGPKSGSSTYRYRDHYGLLGGIGDQVSAFSNSLLGAALFGTMRLGGRALGFGFRGARRAGHLGYRFLRTRGLDAAVKVVPGIGRSAIGLAGTVGRMAMGPIGIGLAAHEIDTGVNQNLTGATRRVADTAAKAVEYGAFGAMFGGPVGALVGAGVGALVANMDYVSKEFGWVGRIAEASGRSIWSGVSAVSRGLWDVAKFAGNAGVGLWTTIFGRSAKIDRNGHVIRQHKASLLEDFRIAFFGRKEERTRTGEIAVTGRRSLFGMIQYGFQKTLFGDKFSNGSYKEGTSLIDEIGHTIRKGLSSMTNFFKTLPKTINNGMASMWSWIRGDTNWHIGSLFSAAGRAKNKVVGKVAGGVAKTKGKVVSGIAAVEGFGPHLLHSAETGLRIGKEILTHPYKGLPDLRNAVRHKLRESELVREIADHPRDAIKHYIIGSFSGTPVESTAGDFYAAGAWIMASRQLKDPKSPYYKYVHKCLDAYGISDTGLYLFVHSIETSQEKIRKKQIAPFNKDDMAYMAGRFGLDPKSPDCVNYFTTWYNQRFLPVVSIISKVVTSYKFSTNTALAAPKATMEKINADLDTAFSALPTDIADLKPSLTAYRKYRHLGTEVPRALTPVSEAPPKGYDPKAIQAAIKKYAAPDIGQASQDPLSDLDTRHVDGLRNGPANVSGKVTDQPEYKQAFGALDPNIQKEVAKNKSLQFVLWSTAVQHGPKIAAKIFAEEYRPGGTTSNYIRDIYQDRSTKFTDTTSGDRVTAFQKLGREMSYAEQIDNGSIDPSVSDMGTEIGHPVGAYGDGTLAHIRAVPLSGTDGTRAKAALDYLINKKHVPYVQAIGEVANFLRESHLDWTNTSGDPSSPGGAHGIGQWHIDRREAIQKQFGKPVEAMGLEEQLDAANWELKGGDLGTGMLSHDAVNAFWNAKTVPQAVRAMTVGFERPHDPDGEAAERTGIAMSLDKKYNALYNQSNGQGQQGDASIVASPDISAPGVTGPSGVSGASVTPVSTSGASAAGASAAGASAATPPVVTVNVDHKAVAREIVNAAKQQMPQAPATSTPTVTPVSDNTSSSTTGPILIHNNPVVQAAQQKPGASMLDMNLKKQAPLTGVSA